MISADPTQRISLNENLVLKNAIQGLYEYVIKDNTFDNPDYYKAKKYNRSTKGISPNIKTYSVHGRNLYVGRGYLHKFQLITSHNDIELKIEDNTSCPEIIYPELINIILRDYQQKILKQVGDTEQGVIVAPTGSGKTIIGLSLIQKLGTSTLILVHKKELLTQWKLEVEKLLGFTPGIIGSGKFSIGDEITIATIQTLAKKGDKLKDIKHLFGCVILDEAHHCPAATFERVIKSFPARYRYGLSATPERADGLTFILERTIGPVIAEVSREEVERKGGIVKARIKKIRTGHDPIVRSWCHYISTLNTSSRNHLILGLVTSLIESGKSVLVLVDRIDHAKDLAELIRGANIEVVLAHGAIPSEERNTLLDRLKTAEVTVGTTNLIGEGLNIEHWDSLILASPISSEPRLLQAIGRVVRPHDDKEVGDVYDLVDSCGYAVGSFSKRLEIYKSNGMFIEFGQEKSHPRSKDGSNNNIYKAHGVNHGF